jgi:DNA-binding response OmpR family regulator/class 3 adenylate cyclase/tetratricopeptide (TPR) repeat protein
LSRRTVLVAAADVALRAEMARTLRSAGYAPELAEGAKRARQIAAGTRLDLAIVATGQLGADGVGLARELGDTAGALLVLADPAEAERLDGAFPGAVVPLARPTDSTELLARVAQAIARPAAETEPPAPLLCFDGWRLDPEARTLVDAGDRDVALTDREFRLLVAFARHSGRVRSREQLRDAIGGRDLDAFDRSIDMQVSRLRRKIEKNPKEPRLIVTVAGAGYKFAARVEPAVPGGRRLPAKPAPVGSAAPERRFLTVLSCSFCGFAALSDAQDPEDVREATADLAEACGAIVRRFGGVVAQFVGDGFTAYFGYPEAHEDDAERAILAGTALIDAIGGSEPGLPRGLEPRIGVAAGATVVAGLGNGGADGPLAVGEAPRTAARLCAAAKGDWVVVEPLVRRRARGSFGFAPLDPVPVAASAEPLQAWRVVGAVPDLGRFAARHGGDPTPLAGRSEELAMLCACWRRAKGGAGQVVVLRGEPGIGKSRLVFELERSIAAQQHIRLACFGSPYHTDSPLFPVLRHLERAAAFAAHDEPREKLAKLAALLGRSDAEASHALPLLAVQFSLPHADAPRLLALSPQRRKELTLAALNDAVARLAAKEPVLMVWEDVQWLDSVSLELLASEVERAARLRLLLVATARPGFAAPWPDHAHVRQLSPARLARDEAEELVRNLAPGDALPAAAVREILDRADGVPLFLEELVKQQLSATTPAERAREPRVPDTLEGLLLGRIDRLGAAGKAVAQIGAAIGRSFSYELLRLVDGGADLDATLGRLTASELVFRRGVPPQASYQFKHTLVRDAAYGTLSARRRRDLHGRIAAALEAHFPDIAETQPELLARHYAEAGNPEKAIGYLLSAAERALLRSAGAEARAQIDAALELLAGLPADAFRYRQELVAQILLHRVVITTRGRTAPEVGPALQRARELCLALDDQVQLPSVLFGQWYAAWSAAAFSEARVHASALADWAKDHRCPAAGTFAEYALGMCLLSCGSLRDARRRFEAAHALDRFEGLPGGLVAGYWAEGSVRVSSLRELQICLFLLGCIAAARQAARQAQTGEQAISHPYGRAIALLLTCRNHALRYDARSLLKAAPALLEHTGLQGYPDFAAHAMAYRGWALAVTGDPRQGIELVRAGLDRCRAVGYLTWHSQLLMLRADCHLHAGDRGQALDVLAEAGQVIGETGERFLEAELHRLRGEIYARSAQDVRTAESAFLEAIEIARRQGARLLELRAAASLARAYLARNRRDAADAVLGPVLGRFPRRSDYHEIKAARALLAGDA